MMSFKALSLLCISLGLFFQISLGAVRHYKFNVEYMLRRPDCEEHIVMGINGQFPAPTIRAEVGDTLDIALTNKLFTEGTVLHWHGITQYGTPWADGTPSISQCAINPGETFHYRFKVDRPGTYIYHGHYGMQRAAGLYGSLIVDLPMGQNEPFHYDSELNLLLSDWWHTSAQEQQAQLSSIPNRWVGPPQSFLIKGRGQYNCSLAGSLINTTLPQCKFEGGEECAPQILHVDPNKTYRIRIASSTSLANLNFAIANHKMVVVEADGNYVEPFIVDDLDIYSGETYSVIITTNENPNQNYWISVGFIGENLKTPQALTILNYKENNASVFPTSPPPITPQWDDYNRSKIFSQKILARKGTPRPPIYYDRRLLLLNTESLVDGRTMYAINNVTLILPSTPYLVSIKYKLDDAFDQKSPPDNFSSDYDIYNSPVYPNSNTGSGIYMFQLNQVVDVVLQNTNILERIKRSDFHPWHLHGHDFWILGYGDGMFKPGDDETKFNLENPPLRNNAVLFPYGWTALRFKANNPGVWAFHCHVEPHLHMGMGVVFAEAVENVEGIPWETSMWPIQGDFMKKEHK